jgi:hypothetical protein
MTFIDIHKKKNNNKVEFFYTKEKKTLQKKHWANSSGLFFDKAASFKK